MSLVEAATEAARLRLRPILMTSFAFIAGLMPLMRAKGAAALGNRSIGTGAVGGMLTGVIPWCLYRTGTVHHLSVSAGKVCR